MILCRCSRPSNRSVVTFRSTASTDFSFKFSSTICHSLILYLINSFNILVDLTLSKFFVFNFRSIFWVRSNNKLVRSLICQRNNPLLLSLSCIKVFSWRMWKIWNLIVCQFLLRAHGRFIAVMYITQSWVVIFNSKDIPVGHFWLTVR